MSTSAFSLQKLPDWLWYERISDTIEWTTMPLGHPNIARLTGGNTDCYRKPLMGLVQEKRKLILNDWTALRWSAEKLNEVKALLLRLLEENFEIFIWQHNQEEPLLRLSVEKLQNGTLDDQDFRNNISPITTRDLIPLAAALKNISVEELCILNCVRLKELLGHDGFIQTPPFYVLGSEIYDSKFNVAQLTNVIAQDHENLIFSDVWYEDDSPGLEFSAMLRSRYGVNFAPKLPLKFEMAVKDNYENIRSIIKYEDYQVLSLKAVGIESTPVENIEIINQFFSKAKNLKQMHLLNFLEPNINIADHVLNNLSNLSIVYMKPGRNSFFENILNNANNIVDLRIMMPDFSRFGFLGMNLNPDTVLDKLKNLFFYSSLALEPNHIPARFLKKLIKLEITNQTNLDLVNHFLTESEHLELLSCKHLSDTQSLKMLGNKALIHLKELCISDLDCELDLQNALALEKLSITLSDKIKTTYNLSLPAKTIKNLKHLKLSNWIFSLEELQTLLISLDNLEVLELDNVMVTPGQLFAWPEGALNKLREFSYTGNGVDKNIFLGIINSAHNLEKVCLDNDLRYRWHDYSPDDQFQLDHLKKLKTTIDLFTLFSKSKKINDLTIRGLVSPLIWKSIIRKKLTNFEGVLEFVPDEKMFPLEFLENLQDIKLSLEGATISEELIRHILSHGKSLSKDNIKYWNAILDENDIVSSIIIGNNQSTSTSVVNMDTKQKENVKYDLVKVFWGIDTEDPLPVHYRINAFDSLEVGDKIKLKNKTVLDCEQDLKLVSPLHAPYFCENDTVEFAKTVPLNSDEKCFYGKISLDIGSEWQALPSLSTKEKITHLHIPGVNQQDIELKYSLRDRLYYVRIKNQPDKEPKKVFVDFLLKTPWPILRTGEECSNLILKSLAEKYRKNLGDKDLPPSASDDASEYKSEAEILEALQKQTLVGACRHRAIAFLADVQLLTDIGFLSPQNQVRIIENDCHMFVEIEEEGESKDLKENICVDLGGHPARISLSNANAPPGFSSISENIRLPGNTTSSQAVSVTKEKDEPESILNSQFNTWTPNISQAPNLKIYVQNILRGISDTESMLAINNFLVGLDSKKSIEEFRLYLQAEAKGHEETEIFYIDSPEDLICSSKWIEKKGSKGILRDGPGGALHAFLNREDFKGQSKKTPVLVVNWDNFKPNEIVKFNALYDTKERRADGTLLPAHTRVVGLFNSNNPKAYKGNDFFRRWYHSILSSSLLDALSSTESVKNNKVFWSEKSADYDEATEVIDLYESMDWKEILLGRWILKGKDLIFEKGKLEMALEKARAEKKPLEIRNGLWENDKFRTFWQQEKLSGRLEDVQIVSSTGYVWKNILPEEVSVEYLENTENLQLDEHLYILNPSTFNKFVYDYVFKAKNGEIKDQEETKGELFKTAGFFENYLANNPGSKTMHLYLTRALSQHQWAELLEAAKRQKINLNIKVAPMVSMPFDLELALNRAQESPVRIHVENKIKNDKSEIYLSSDIHYTVSNLKNKLKNIPLAEIDVSELEAQDLLDRTQAKMDGLEYLFTNRKNALFLALKEGKTVILKGKFKAELIDNLASLCVPDAHLWINGQKIVLEGKLILVSEPDKAFDFSSCTNENEKEILEHKTQLINEIKYALKDSFELSEQQKIYDWLNTRSSIQLSTILKYLKAGGLDPRNNWEGLINLDNKKDKILNMDLSLKASEDFKGERFKQIDAVLRGTRNNPFVFVAGSTGVGKSSFIQKELEKIPDSPYKIYVGIENIQQWAENTKNADYPVLFIDEANIDAGDFKNYEGLFDTPPHMLINGKDIILTDKHKVIFAGNPLSYGSRKLPSLFNDYGGSIIFPPMAPAYLYHKVLKPILSTYKLLSDESQDLIGAHILSVYQKIVEMTEDSVLITARELQMMALLIMTKLEATQDLNEQTVANIIKRIAEPLIPNKHKESFEKFCVKKWGALNEIEPVDRFIPATASTDAFLVTVSRRSIENEFNDFLALRQLKRKTTEDAIKIAPGLGGIVLEGEPGLGKSEFVINLLVKKGFKEKSLESVIGATDLSQNYFYKMPVSMQAADKEKLLLRAFHEGSVVIIDELNSSPMMEKLLNALLMGYDLEGNPARNPGFMIIATQNPISMAARQAASSAVEHRFIKRIFHPYTDIEMKDIVHHRGLSMRESEDMVEDYSRVRQYAIDNHKEPAPTFGHVMTAVKWKLEAQKRTRALVFKEASVKAARLALEREKAKAIQKKIGVGSQVILSPRAKFNQEQEEHSDPLKKFPDIGA